MVMKNKFITVILLIVAVVSVVFGYFQKVRATKAEARLLGLEKSFLELTEEADAQRKSAEQQRALALAAREEAERQMKIAQAKKY